MLTPLPGNLAQDGQEVQARRRGGVAGRSKAGVMSLVAFHWLHTSAGEGRKKTTESHFLLGISTSMVTFVCSHRENQREEIHSDYL